MDDTKVGRITFSAVVAEQATRDIIQIQSSRITELEASVAAAEREGYLRGLREAVKLLRANESPIATEDAALQILMGAEHLSDCAVHNAPAYAKGRCDCGVLALAEGGER
jgi:hypothetical protein